MIELPKACVVDKFIPKKTFYERRKQFRYTLQCGGRCIVQSKVSGQRQIRRIQEIIIKYECITKSSLVD